MSFLLILFGLFIITTAACTFALTSFVPYLNLKDDFTEFHIKKFGRPPSRKKLLLSLNGAGSYYFLFEKCFIQEDDGAVRMVATPYFLQLLILRVASIVMAILLWILGLFLYAALKTFVFV